MQGTDLNRPIGAETLDDIPEENLDYEGYEVPEKEQSGGLSIDLSFLKTPTGEGTIEERLDHPLNFSHSRGIAQIIRGLEGIFGSLSLAIVDIALGLLEVIKERRAAAA